METTGEGLGSGLPPEAVSEGKCPLKSSQLWFPDADYHVSLLSLNPHVCSQLALCPRRTLHEDRHFGEYLVDLFYA